MKAKTTNDLKQAELHIRQWLVRLEGLHTKLKQSEGYGEPVQKLRILTELLREQLPNENTHPANDQTR